MVASRVCRQTCLLNQRMILLQRLNSAFATVTVLNRFNSLYSGNSPSQRCYVTYLVLQTHFADCLPVLSIVSLSFWCVDYKANFLVHNTAGQGTLTLEALTQPFCGFLKHYQPAIKSTTSGRPAPILFTTSHLIPFAL